MIRLYEIKLKTLKITQIFLPLLNIFTKISYLCEDFVKIKQHNHDYMEKLTLQEEEAMRVVWQTGRGFIKDYLEAYPEPRLPYTTLASIVKNLERKNYVASRKYGNSCEYTPLIKEEEYKRVFMSGFVRNYFKNSYKDLVTFFVNEKALSPKELRELATIIEQQESV